MNKIKGKARIGDIMRKHGLYNTPEYKAWEKAKARCCNPNHPKYPRYGGRGIRMCDRWLNSFENFYADMGPRPSPDHSIEREDNDGDYEPNNCRWATRKEQMNNRAACRYFEHKGKRQTITQWAREYGLKPQTVRQRLIDLGEPIEIALRPSLGRGGNMETRVKRRAEELSLMLTMKNLAEAMRI